MEITFYRTASNRNTFPTSRIQFIICFIPCNGLQHSKAWLSQILENLSCRSICDGPGQRPGQRQRRGRTPSWNPHIVSGNRARMQSYWHCRGSLRTKTPCICQQRHHRQIGRPTFHKGLHHGVGSTWRTDQQGEAGAPVLKNKLFVYTKVADWFYNLAKSPKNSFLPQLSDVQNIQAVHPLQLQSLHPNSIRTYRTVYPLGHFEFSFRTIMGTEIEGTC